MRLHQRSSRLRALLVQPYVLFHLVFLCYLCHCLAAYWSMMKEYTWLDSSTFEHRGARLIRTVQSRYYGTRQLQRPNHLFKGLRYMCILSPVSVVLTYVVTLLQVWRHHLPRRRGFDEELRWYPSHSHDLAMQVVAMPEVYGILALDSVVVMMQLMTGQAFSAVAAPGHAAHAMARHAHHMSLMTFHSNMEVADLYEAWALRHFARLCLMRIGRRIRREAPLLQRMIERDRLELVPGRSTQLEVLENPEACLFKPLEATTGMGLKVFVYTYGLKSVYMLLLTILSDAPFFIDLPKNFPAAASLVPCVQGAAFLASTIAIYNLVVLEHSFKHLLKSAGFTPVLKFWGVKALVSITFIQRLVMDIVMSKLLNYTDEQIDLCYACAICMQVLPLSLLTALAWRPRCGDWYGDDKDPAELLSIPRGRLANEDDWINYHQPMFDQPLLTCGNHMPRQKSFLAHQW